jgi:hypothetical protein
MECDGEHEARIPPAGAEGHDFAFGWRKSDPPASRADAFVAAV